MVGFQTKRAKTRNKNAMGSVFAFHSLIHGFTRLQVAYQMVFALIFWQILQPVCHQPRSWWYWRESTFVCANSNCLTQRNRRVIFLIFAWHLPQSASSKPVNFHLHIDALMHQFLCLDNMFALLQSYLETVTNSNLYTNLVCNRSLGLIWIKYCHIHAKLVIEMENTHRYADSRAILIACQVFERVCLVCRFAVFTSLFCLHYSSPFVFA